MDIVEVLMTVLIGGGTGAGSSYLGFIRNMGEMSGRVSGLESELKKLAEQSLPREVLAERLSRVETTTGPTGEIRSEVKEVRGQLQDLVGELRVEIQHLRDTAGDSLKRDEFAEYVTATGQRLDRLLERLGEVRGKLEASGR